jgi:hypothetical protein
MAARMWWVSGLVTVLLPALVEAKGAGLLSPRGTRRETTSLRTHPLPDVRGLQQVDGRRAAARDPFADFDPVSEAIWGALVADPRRQGGGLREPARADGADVIDGCGSKDFPIASPNARGTQHTHRHTHISLRDLQARGGRRGSTYDGILERMRADREQMARLDAPPSVTPSARVSATAEEAPWFGIADAPQELQRALFPRPAVDRRTTPGPALEPAPVAKELLDEGSLVEQSAINTHGAAARMHTSSRTQSSTASSPISSGFPGHQSGLVDRAWEPRLHPDRH